MVGTRKLLRGHYNPTNWSRKYPNLQKVITPAGVRVLACTTCIKTFSKKTRMAVKKAKRDAVKAAKAAEPAKAAPVKEKAEAKPKKEKKEIKKSA